MGSFLGRGGQKVVNLVGHRSASRRRGSSTTMSQITRERMNAQVGPDRPGDVVVMLRRNTTKQKQAGIIGKLLRSRLTVKVRSIRTALMVANEGWEGRKVGCVCCPCACCKAHPARSACAALINILPACLRVSGVATSDIDYVIFVSASNERMAEEHLVRETKNWLNSEGSGDSGGFAAMAKMFADSSASKDQAERHNWMPAERSALLFNAVSEAGLKASDDPSDAIAQIFTLHDTEIVNTIMDAMALNRMGYKCKICCRHLYRRLCDLLRCDLRRACPCFCCFRIGPVGRLRNESDYVDAKALEMMGVSVEGRARSTSGADAAFYHRKSRRGLMVVDSSSDGGGGGGSHARRKLTHQSSRVMARGADDVRDAREENHASETYFDNGAVLYGNACKCCCGPLLRCKRAVITRLRNAVIGSVIVPKMRYVTWSNLQHSGLYHIPRHDHYIHELRSSYGDEVAWFFAFNQHFLDSLLFPAVLGLVVVIVMALYTSVSPPEHHCSGSWWSDAAYEFMWENNIQPGIRQMIEGARAAGNASSLPKHDLPENIAANADLRELARSYVPTPTDEEHKDCICLVCKQMQVIFILLVTLFWGPYFIASWRNRAHELRYRWNIAHKDSRMGSERNPDFRGTAVIEDPVTGEHVPIYPAWKRTVVTILRLAFVFFFFFLWIWIASFVVLLFIMLRAHYDSPAWDMLSMLKDIIHAISIAALGTLLFKGIVGLIIRMENIVELDVKERRETATNIFLDYWNFLVMLLLLALCYFPVARSGLLAHMTTMNKTVVNDYYVSFYGQYPDPENIVAARFRKEQFAGIMVGVVLVSRIFVTLFGTILPLMVQKRRRQMICKSIMSSITRSRQQWKKINEENRERFQKFKKFQKAVETKVSDRMKRGLSKRGMTTTASTNSVGSVDGGAEAPAGAPVESKAAEGKPALLGSASIMEPKSLRGVLRLQKMVRTLRAKRQAAFRRLSLKSADGLVEEGAQDEFNAYGFYNDICVQFGVLLIFSVTAPWTAFVMLLLNVFDLRWRLITLLYGFRAPKPRRTRSVGTWRPTLTYIYFAALVIMPVMVLYTGV
eukprot:g73.t1